LRYYAKGNELGEGEEELGRVDLLVVLAVARDEKQYRLKLSLAEREFKLKFSSEKDCERWRGRLLEWRRFALELAELGGVGGGGGGEEEEEEEKEEKENSIFNALQGVLGGGAGAGAGEGAGAGPSTELALAGGGGSLKKSSFDMGSRPACLRGSCVTTEGGQPVECSTGPGEGNGGFLFVASRRYDLKLLGSCEVQRKSAKKPHLKVQVGEEKVKEVYQLQDGNGDRVAERWKLNIEAWADWSLMHLGGSWGGTNLENFRKQHSQARPPTIPCSFVSCWGVVE